MNTPMKKVPSALKWLAESRARMAGKLHAAEYTLALVHEQVRAAEEKLASLRTLQALCEEKRAQHAKALGALDGTVTIFDENIKPASIGAVHGWAGRYGKRGALRAFLHETLKARAPHYVSTSELAVLAIMEFSLLFSHWEERKTWFRNSLRNALVGIEQAGHIERSTDACEIVEGTEVRGWRVKQEAPQTLSGLQAGSGRLGAD